MSSFCQRVEEICPLLFSVLSIMEKIQQINKRSTPIIVALGIVLSVVFGSYDTAKATGMEELFYYTYFDLMSGLFAETGMDFALKDDYYTKSDRVSGKQVWDNFCTWVENKAKTLALPVEVVNKTVFDELKDLPNKVTSAGATMSEKLSELLAKVLPTFNSSSSDLSSYAKVREFISSVLGVPENILGGSVANSLSKGQTDLYILQLLVPDDCLRYEVFGLPHGASFVSINWDYYGSSVKYLNSDGNVDSVGLKPLEIFGYEQGSRWVAWDYIDKGWTFKDSYRNYDYTLIVSAGDYVVKDYAKVKTVDDNTVYVPGVGYKTNWDIWKDIVNDKVTTDAEEDAWNSRYNLDNDNKDDKEKKKKDNEKDKLPVAIPIIPFKKPDSSDKDKDTEQSTEKTSASPIINPKTGNVIDPETGYDIDPETGKLVDPKTGKLIDRDMSDTSSKLLKYGDIRKIFPFCIPFDIVDMIRGLRAEKAPPVFHFDYYFKGIDYTFTVDVDLSDYDKYIKLFRGGMVIFFVLALMWLTVKVSKFFS